MAWEGEDKHGVPTPVREGGRLKFHAAANVPRRRTIRYVRIVVLGWLGCSRGVGGASKIRWKILQEEGVERLHG